jgi:hypothetical protein
MKAAVLLALAGSAVAFTSSPPPKASTQLRETQADLQAMAVKLNPVLKVCEPCYITFCVVLTDIF